ncbi:TonB-dependent receptor plug domain-containing protein [Achromobacter xylosoxidans]
MVEDAGADPGLRLAAPDHSLFRYLTLADVTWHQHGTYAPPPGAVSLVDKVGAGSVLYEDRCSTAGRLIVTSLDPMYHHGSYFMPATSRFLRGFLPWLKDSTPPPEAAFPGLPASPLRFRMTHSFPPSSFFRAVLLAAASLGAPAMAADTAQLPAIRVTADDAAADAGRLHAIGAVPPPATLDHTVTQSVSVVDRQDLDRLSAISTLELLGRIPNATINLGGGIGGTLFLRGMDTLDMRVPVFIDGDRFRGRNKLQFMLISPTELEAVEVVRGPDSARFGSDGLGGLINFVTKRAHGNLEHGFALGGGEVSATWQSNGNGMQANAALEAAGDGFDLRVYATGRRAGNFRSAAGKVPNSDFRSAGGGIVLGYMPDARQRFEISGRIAHVNEGWAGTVPPYPLATTRSDPLDVKQEGWPIGASSTARSANCAPASTSTTSTPSWWRTIRPIRTACWTCSATCPGRWPMAAILRQPSRGPASPPRWAWISCMKTGLAKSGAHR